MFSLINCLKSVSNCFLRNSFVSTNCLTNRSFSSVTIGSTAQLCKTFSEEDVKAFAKLTGDYNPIHLDHNYCSKTKFSKPIVHGMLTNGLVSAVFATLLPGPGAVVVEQTINFAKPLYIGEEVCAQITVTNVRKRFIECKYICWTQNTKKIMDGTAKLVLI